MEVNVTFLARDVVGRYYGLAILLRGGPEAVESRGGELMKAYELLFFVNPAIDEESRLAANKRIENVITADGGAIDKADNWGKRKLAYEINGLADGDYTLVDFHADPANIAELDRVLRITDAIERHMIVCREDRD